MKHIRLAILEHFTLKEIAREDINQMVDALYELEPRFKWEPEYNIQTTIENLKKELKGLSTPEPKYVNELPIVVQDILVATQAKLLSDNGLKRLDVDLYTDDMLNSKISDLDELLYLVKDSINYK